MDLPTYTCPECGTWHLGHYFSESQSDHLCSNCHNFKDSAEIESSVGIRCPHCREVTRDDLYEITNIYTPGTHEIFCDYCDKEYEIHTEISVVWTSPELKPC